MPAMEVRRLGDGPIIAPGMDARMGTNINGPSVIPVPDWVPNPLGRYYLYFADHRGTYIRLAHADAVTGPWRIHGPGCLDLADSRFVTDSGTLAQLQGVTGAARAEAIERDYLYAHIASPDVQVLEAPREIRMYFHGLCPDGWQRTRVARSTDGLTFAVEDPVLAEPYLRVFQYDGWHYGLAVFGKAYRSRTGLAEFEEADWGFDRKMRHPAVLRRGDRLHVFWTRVGDCPEHILYSSIALDGDWCSWRASAPQSVLKPALAWEGAEAPLVASRLGAIDRQVNQLRDPFVFEDTGRTFLFYCGAGESCIGLAEAMISL